MGLGSSNSLGQAKGKSVARISKRHREVVAAKSFHAITGSAVTGESTHNGSCNTSEAVNKTYYHNAGSSSGYTTNTVLYTKARENDRYKLI